MRQGGSFKTKARTVFRDIGRNPSIADAPSLVACYFSCHLHLLSVARYLCPCYLPSSPADCFSYPSLAVARHLPGCTLPVFCPLTHRPIACYHFSQSVAICSCRSSCATNSPSIALCLHRLLPATTSPGRLLSVVTARHALPALRRLLFAACLSLLAICACRSVAVVCLLTCYPLSALVVRGRFPSCVFNRKTKRSDKTCRKQGVLRCSWSVVRMKKGCLLRIDSPFYF